MRTLDDAEVATHVATIAEHGYTIVLDAIEHDLIDALSERLLAIEHEHRVLPAGNAFEGAHTVRIYNLLAYAGPFVAVPAHRNVLTIIERVLDTGCLISSLSSIAIDPGERAQPIHADDQVLAIPKPHPPLVCNSMWALDDFTEENGATRVIPGSHRLPSPEFGKHYDSIPAAMPRGGVLIWTGSLWHGGGANRSTARRTGIAMNYCAGIVRQQENQQLGVPLALARTFPRRVQELMGYAPYRDLVGHIDKHSPLDLLGSGEPFRSIWDR